MNDTTRSALRTQAIVIRVIGDRVAACSYSLDDVRNAEDLEKIATALEGQAQVAREWAHVVRGGS